MSCAPTPGTTCPQGQVSIGRGGGKRYFPYLLQFLETEAGKQRSWRLDDGGSRSHIGVVIDGNSNDSIAPSLCFKVSTTTMHHPLGCHRVHHCCLVDKRDVPVEGGWRRDVLIKARQRNPNSHPDTKWFCRPRAQRQKVWACTMCREVKKARCPQ